MVIERFRSASPRHQVMAAAGAVLAVSLALGALWFFLLRSPYEPLFSHMRSTDAATVVAELDRRKIPYRLGNGGATILVPSDKVDATRLAVMSEDLPLKGTVGFELFNKSDLGLTDFAQKINYQRALQGELARTIMALDGVESARVHLSLGEDRLFRDDRIPPKASVTIRMKEGVPFSIRAAEGVQRLIAAAVPRLDVGNVVILDEAGVAITVSDSPESAPVSPFVMERQAIEQYYQARIQNAVEPLYPRGAVTVTVQADMPPQSPASDLSEWTPAARAFALQVGLATQTPPTPQMQMDVRDRVMEAIGFDPSLGDNIAFVRSAGLAAPPAASEPHHDRQRLAPDMGAVSESKATGKGPIWLALLVLAAGSALLLFRRRRPILAPSDRSAFAARLKAALEEEDDHAAAPV